MSRAADPAPPLPFPDQRSIVIRGAREHNLKNVDLTIPRDKLVVFTGLSGSGKSSLAFDTIYAEGQRRYVESLSAYARQFLEMMQKPDVDQIDGLSPAISIEQKTTSKNPRSTVGTVTEIYDYMRLLWARVGVPYSPATGLPIESQTVSQMVDRVLALPEKTRLYLLAPVVRGRKGEYRKEIAEFMKKGFQRAEDRRRLLRDRRRRRRSTRSSSTTSTWWWTASWCARTRRRGWPKSFETALELADGIAIVEFADEKDEKGQPQAHHVLLEVRLPGVGLHDPGDRAAAVLVQQSVRRLPDLRRASASSRRSTPSWSFPIPRRHCARAPIAPWAKSSSPYYLQTLEALGKHYKFRLDTPWQELPKKARDAILYGSGDEEIRFSYDDGLRAYDVKKPFEGVVTQPRAPLHRDGKRMGARGNLALHVGDALRGLRWPSPEARSAAR